MGIHTRTRRNTLALFAGVLIMGFLVGPANVAVGETPPEPVIVDRGVLIVELGPVDQLRYIAPDGTVSTQAITTQACKVTLKTDGAVLATIDPLPASSVVGLFDDGIGVQTKGEKGGNGQPCGQANGPSEGLVFKLAGDLAGYEIDFSELDIEGKFNVLVDFGLYLDGTKVADGTPLGTGDKSDSGPDSGDGDNYRWNPEEDLNVDVRYDEVRMTVDSTTPSGAFSLEGGADGTMPGTLGISGSAFKLVEEFDGIIDCGDSTFPVGDGTNTPEATFTRGNDDAKNPDPCTELIGYNLSSQVNEDENPNQSVTFEFETEEAPSWFGTFTWTPEPLEIPVKATMVDAGDGTPAFELQWCAGFGETVTIEDDMGNVILTYERPVLPTRIGQSEPDPWCLLTQTSTLLDDSPGADGGEMIQVTQTIYGETDPSFIRPK